MFLYKVQILPRVRYILSWSPCFRTLKYPTNEGVKRWCLSKTYDKCIAASVVWQLFFELCRVDCMSWKKVLTRQIAMFCHTSLFIKKCCSKDATLFTAFESWMFREKICQISFGPRYIKLSIFFKDRVQGRAPLIKIAVKGTYLGGSPFLSYLVGNL